MKTTFKKIRSFSPCESGWKKLIGYYKPEDYSEEIKISEIVKSNGVKDAIWALRAVDDKKKIMLFCADVAESVLHIYEKYNSENKAVKECIEAARLFAADKISKNELAEKRNAAAYAVYTARAYAAARAADAAAYAATYAVYADAAYAVVHAARAAGVKWIEISELLRKYCEE